MPLLFAASLFCLYLAGTDSAAAYPAALLGTLLGFLACFRAAFLLTRRGT